MRRGATSVRSTGSDPHRRLSRTLARSRWGEYRALLEHARRHGYRVISLERFAGDPPRGPTRCLILRHDVDQHPRSALTMAAIEREAGVNSTWYFRWRTADPTVIKWLRSHGFEIGLHYETVTRRLRSLGRGADALDEALIDSCRAELRAEIELFVHRFGPISSVCPHGDTRVPDVHNGLLLRDQPPEAFGGLIDSNEAMRGRELAAWMTDRSMPDGGWGGGVRPNVLLEQGTSPVLCLTHPNNWASGSGLLLDRLVGIALPGRLPPAPIRTRRDDPPYER